MCQPYSNSMSQEAKGDKKYFSLLIFIITSLISFTTACVGSTSPEAKNTNNKAKTVDTGKPINSSISDVEFILDLTPQEKVERAKLIELLPTVKKASETVSKFGFKVATLKADPDARSYPIEESLTGLIYSAEDSQRIGGHTFRVIFMGPTNDKLDTIRFQSWGIQTRQARQRLQVWANNTLASFEKGKLPDDFIQKLFAGETVGNDGVFNGFCNVQVLQRPINPSRPSVDDRISLDLIFYKGAK